MSKKLEIHELTGRHILRDVWYTVPNSIIEISIAEQRVIEGYLASTGVPPEQARQHLNALLRELGDPSSELSVLMDLADVIPQRVCGEIRAGRLVFILLRIQKQFEQGTLTPTRVFASPNAATAFMILTNNDAPYEWSNPDRAEHYSRWSTATHPTLYVPYDKVKRVIEQMMAACGNPDPAAGCRLVIEIGKEALPDEEECGA